jgi:hypothetical protein
VRTEGHFSGDWAVSGITENLSRPDVLTPLYLGQPLEGEILQEYRYLVGKLPLSPRPLALKWNALVGKGEAEGDKDNLGVQCSNAYLYWLRAPCLPPAALLEIFEPAHRAALAPS